MNPWHLTIPVVDNAVRYFVTKTSLFSEVYKWDSKIYEPPETTIIVPTLNEETYIRETLLSLEEQNVRDAFPDKFEVIVVDNESRDETVEIARQFGAKIIEEPRPGKLYARHVGIMKAEKPVVVGLDGDTIYPPNWLNLVLRHFRDPDVVGVSSPRLYGKDSNPIFDFFLVNYSVPLDYLTGRMPGCNSAFRKQAYHDTGGFDFEVDQFTGWKIQQEEEFRFPCRLRQVGKVVWEWKAPSLSSARRLSKGHRSTFVDENPLLYPEV